MGQRNQFAESSNMVSLFSSVYVVLPVEFWRVEMMKEIWSTYVVSCNFSLYGMGQNGAEEESGEKNM